MTGSLKITHDAWKKTKDKETKRDKVPAELREQFQAAMKSNDQIEIHLARASALYPRLIRPDTRGQGPHMYNLYPNGAAVVWGITTQRPNYVYPRP